MSNPRPNPSTNGYDAFNQSWVNAPLPASNGAASFDHNVASSHAQSHGFQQHGAPVVPYSYSNPNRIPGASEATSQHAAAAYAGPMSPGQVQVAATAFPQFAAGASGSTSRRDSRGGHPQPAPPSSGPAQDYNHPTAASTAAWTPAPYQGRQPGVDHNQPPSLVYGQQDRLVSSQVREGARRPPVDAGPGTLAGTQQKCIIPGCQYETYYNVAEQEQMEYCGHGHEIQAMETGFVKRCAMCKRRPRRSGERVCGRVCREQQRYAPQVQGSYYGVQVTRREPHARPR